MRLFLLYDYICVIEIISQVSSLLDQTGQTTTACEWLRSRAHSCVAVVCIKGPCSPKGGRFDLISASDHTRGQTGQSPGIPGESSGASREHVRMIILV